MMAALLVAATSAVSAEPRYEVQVTKYLMDTQIDATVICADVVEGKRGLLRAFGRSNAWTNSSGTTRGRATSNA